MAGPQATLLCPSERTFAQRTQTGRSEDLKWLQAKGLALSYLQTESHTAKCILKFAQTRAKRKAGALAVVSENLCASQDCVPVINLSTALSLQAYLLPSLGRTSSLTAGWNSVHTDIQEREGSIYSGSTELYQTKKIVHLQPGTENWKMGEQIFSPSAYILQRIGFQNWTCTKPVMDKCGVVCMLDCCLQERGKKNPKNTQH